MARFCNCNGGCWWWLGCGFLCLFVWFVFFFFFFLGVVASGVVVEVIVMDCYWFCGDFFFNYYFNKVFILF